MQATDISAGVPLRQPSTSVSRYGITVQPISGVFYVDDNRRNVDAARAAGMDAVRFTDAATLLGDLQGRGLLD